MGIKNILRKSILVLGLGLLSTVTFAQQNGPIDFPALDDARLFYQSTDKEPTLVIYYTQNTFDQVRAFYTQEYGAPISRQTVYGRLELQYSYLDQDIRVIVDDRDNSREVDLMIEQAK